jgi:hypothetical protein
MAALVVPPLELTPVVVAVVRRHPWLGMATEVVLIQGALVELLVPVPLGQTVALVETMARPGMPEWRQAVGVEPTASPAAAR